jgi:beta-lactamase class D
LPRSRPLIRLVVSGLFSLCAFVAPGDHAAPQQPSQPLATALRTAVEGTAAVAVVQSVAGGHVIAMVRAREAEDLRVSPGSTLKPLFLSTALEEKTIYPDTRVFCRRSLHIAGHDLRCTHPQTASALNASEALAYSCNTYFAALATRMRPASLLATLHYYGLGGGPAPGSNDDKQLLVLGLKGVALSPMQLAEAYRRLWMRFKNPTSSAALQPVHQGLRDSIEYGMAHNAAVEGMEFYGKTGTAAEPGEFRTHGWFAGVATLEGNEDIIVIYLPNASGGDAASLASRFVQLVKSGRQR